MTCEWIADGFVVCNRGKRWPSCRVPGCGRRAPFLCDYPVKRGTCDAALCDVHAIAQPSHHRVAPGSTPDRIDYCAPHHAHAQRQGSLAL